MACAFGHSLVSNSYLTLVLRVAQTCVLLPFLIFSTTLKFLALYARQTVCLSQPVWLNRIARSFNFSISASVERSNWGKYSRFLLQIFRIHHQNAVHVSKEAQEPQARPLVDGRGISAHHCNADIDGYRFPQSIPDIVMARWSRQWIQQCSERGTVCSSKLHTVQAPHGLVQLVCYPLRSNIQEPAADPGNSMTSYNLVLGVLSTFFIITKLPTHWMNLFYPPVAVVVHASLIILYIVSAVYQAGSDMSDPKHPQPGAPWYIAKSCSVAFKKSNVGYCMQAKALFAVTVVMMLV